MGIRAAIRELWLVVHDADFVRDPLGMLAAWALLVLGRVDVDSPVRMADEVRTARPHYAAAIMCLLRAWVRG